MACAGNRSIEVLNQWLGLCGLRCIIAEIRKRSPRRCGILRNEGAARIANTDKWNAHHIAQIIEALPQAVEIVSRDFEIMLGDQCPQLGNLQEHAAIFAQLLDTLRLKITKLLPR